MMAAQESSSLAGEYQLGGVREVASVLILNPDSSFAFYFSYGAVDRTGTGRWQWNEKERKICLNSAPRPAADYALLQSTHENSDLITIRISDSNRFLLPYTQVRVQTTGGTFTGTTDSKGQVSFPSRPISRVELLFELCPERSSSFPVADSTLNNFEFRFEPWISTIFFQDITLEPVAEGLRGAHPLLAGQHYVFHKL